MAGVSIQYGTSTTLVSDRRWPVARQRRGEPAITTGLLLMVRMIQKKIEFPPPPQPEHIVLLIELIAAFQKIPQRYCLLCKAKTSLGIEGTSRVALC
jgi:hypothetical protein